MLYFRNFYAFLGQCFYSSCWDAPKVTLMEGKVKVSNADLSPLSPLLNPYCQRILVKVYAVMLDEQRERASGSQLVRCAGLETA